jgi:DNA topoisomerase-2
MQVFFDIPEEFEQYSESGYKPKWNNGLNIDRATMLIDLTKRVGVDKINELDLKNIHDSWKLWQYARFACNKYDETNKKIVEKTINFIPGLYKLFDEAIVNCRDHALRMEQLIASTTEQSSGEVNYPVTHISIVIGDDGIITLTNDGNGIDIAKHPENGLWIPEMIFGHLRTSSNYEETGKIVGGKNGFGAKLTNIFSKEFTIETVDSDEKKFFRQTFTNNMRDRTEPEIKTSKSSSYTSVSFIPDYPRFGFKNITLIFNLIIN